ncbi:MAG TPA: four helix bundle protein [Ignavibacteriaceae bacterium]|nr:four helix bundle protein [Ignavibacteriaceae bacterium]
MDKEDLLSRTKRFALDIINFIDFLPQNNKGVIISRQILKSGTSVGANYRAACRSKSKDDFIYKIKIVEEEADETLFWLEIINEASFVSNQLLRDLLKEADELTAIFTSIAKTSQIFKYKESKS